MNFHEFDDEDRFHTIWNSVTIHRRMEYSLFTFGDSELPYYLVIDSENDGDLVTLRKGTVKITRPMLITPDNAQPEFRNFFDDNEFGGMVDFLLSRSAAFSNLKIENTSQKSEFVSDSVEEIVARLQKQLDADEEDRMAVLSAPYGYGSVAIFRYTTQCIIESAPDNIQELRERGFLPD